MTMHRLGNNIDCKVLASCSHAAPDDMKNVSEHSFVEVACRVVQRSNVSHVKKVDSMT